MPCRLYARVGLPRMKRWSGMKKAATQSPTRVRSFRNQNLQGAQRTQACPGWRAGAGLRKGREPSPGRRGGCAAHPLCSRARALLLDLMLSRKAAWARKKQAVPKHTR